jgi:hypothetical protein
MRRTSGATYRATGAGQGFVHDLANSANAAAALGAAAEAAIDLSGGARRRRRHGAPHFMVAQHVAGTDDHRKTRRRLIVTFATGFMRASQKKTLFKSVLNY